MTPATYRTSGNAKHWRPASLGGAFENAGIIARIGLIPALKISNIIAWSVIVVLSIPIFIGG